jgi:hypothetical protein
MDNFAISAEGHIKITDLDTMEVLADQDNDILYGNMATALARSLIGDFNFFLSYMAFGNGAVNVTSTGIEYKTTRSTLVKDPNASLYNTILVRQISNESTPSNLYSTDNNATIPLYQEGTNYEDILVRVVLGYNDSDLAAKQSPIDNSPFVNNGGGASGTTEEGQLFVFNEIALFSGPKLNNGDASIEVDIPTFLANPQTLMLTHVIFHPVQKSANRSLEILYTLRIQMGSVD